MQDFRPVIDLSKPGKVCLRAKVNGHAVRGVRAANIVELRAKVRTLRPAQLINHHDPMPPAA